MSGTNKARERRAGGSFRSKPGVGTEPHMFTLFTHVYFTQLSQAREECLGSPDGGCTHYPSNAQQRQCATHHVTALITQNRNQQTHITNSQATPAIANHLRVQTKPPTILQRFSASAFLCVAF